MFAISFEKVEIALDLAIKNAEKLYIEFGAPLDNLMATCDYFGQEKGAIRTIEVLYSMALYEERRLSRKRKSCEL
jgi:hypothetical protein